MIRTFNRLIGPGGIDFLNRLAVSCQKGLRGAVGEIGWTELGNLMGNYFMIAWNMLSGFVTDMARKKRRRDYGMGRTRAIPGGGAEWNVCQDQLLQKQG